MPTTTEQQPQQPKAVKPKVAGTEAKASVLIARKIEREIGRQSGERVVAKPVFGDNFRVNWYVDDPTESGIAVSNRIVKSRFIKATLREDESLELVDQTAQGKRLDDSLLSQYL